MQKIDGKNATEDGQFQEYNPSTGQGATYLTAEWLNAVQGELMAFLEDRGVDPDKDDSAQVYKIVLDMFQSGLTGGAPVYASTAQGLSATPEGGYFSVPSGEPGESLILYRHDSGGVATEVARTPSSYGVLTAEAAAVAASGVAEAQADRSEAEADRSEAARDAAQLSAGVFPDAATGLSSTSDGGYFSVPDGDEDDFLTLYRNESGSAVAVETYPSAAAIRKRLLTTPDIAALRALTGVQDGQRVSVTGYHPGSAVGGGEFYWDESRPKADHNGGTVIDPEKVFPADWSVSAAVDAWFTPASSGAGCWVLTDRDAFTPQTFGVLGNGEFDDTQAYQQVLGYCTENSVSLRVPKPTVFYLISDNIVVDGAVGIDITIDRAAVFHSKGGHTPLDFYPARATIASVEAFFILLNCDSVRVIGGTFDGSAGAWGAGLQSGTVAAHGVFVQNSTNCVVRDGRYLNIGDGTRTYVDPEAGTVFKRDTGVMFIQCENYLCSYNESQNCGYAGFESRIACRNGRFIGNSQPFAGSSTHLTQAPPDYGEVDPLPEDFFNENVAFIGNLGVGVGSDITIHSQGTTVTGNILLDIPETAIDVRNDGHNCTITGNTILWTLEDQGTAAIGIGSGIRDAVVQGNSISNYERAYLGTGANETHILGMNTYYNVSDQSNTDTILGKAAGWMRGNIGNGTYIGAEAGHTSTGEFGVAIGRRAGKSSALRRGTAIGVNSGRNNFGDNKTTIGYEAAYQTSAPCLTAIGAEAGGSIGSSTDDSTGGGSTMIGFRAGYSATVTNRNTFIGGRSGQDSDGEYNVAIGSRTALNSSGSYTTCIGASAGEANAFDNVTLIGYGADATDVDQVQLGGTGSTPYAYNDLQIRSDARDKWDVRDWGIGLDLIERLRVVDYFQDFRESYKEPMPEVPDPIGDDPTDEEVAGYAEAVAQYNSDLQAWRERNSLGNLESDGTHKGARRRQGLIAQEVEAALQDMGIDWQGLHHHNHNGVGEDVYSLNYTALVPVLINAVQQLSARVSEMEGAPGSGAHPPANAE